MTTPSFILELPIQDGDDVRRFLDPKFDFGREVFNATLSTALGRLQALWESKAWREACALEKGKERTKRLNALREAAGLTKYALITVANDHRNAAKRFIPVRTPGVKGKRTPDSECILGAHVAQKIGLQVWKAMERYMFGKGGRPRFKSKRRPLHSLEGQSANATIIWRPSTQEVVWNKRPMKVLIPDTPYVKEALRDPVHPEKPRKVKFCRIVWKMIRGRRRYFLQLVMEGHAPVRHVYAPTSEQVGIDPAPSKVHAYSPEGVLITKAATVDGHEKEIAALQRKMDASRRATNPDNYNADGTAKVGCRNWVFSKNYGKLQLKLNEIHRCLTETRKRDHGTIINLILSLGGSVRVEKNSYLSFQKNFGKSVGKYAVGSLIQRLKNKAESAGLEYVELNPYRLRLSQYEHVEGTYKKKPLSQRWTRVGNCVVQRDIYSAFLAAFANEKSHDPSLLKKEWTRAEPLLRAAGLLRDYDPATDGDLSKSTKEPAFAAAFRRQSGEQLEAFRKHGDSRSPTHHRRRKRKWASKAGKAAGKAVPSR